jgi:dynamin-binding protein
MLSGDMSNQNPHSALSRPAEGRPTWDLASQPLPTADQHVSDALAGNPPLSAEEFYRTFHPPHGSYSPIGHSEFDTNTMTSASRPRQGFSASGASAKPQPAAAAVSRGGMRSASTPVGGAAATAAASRSNPSMPSTSRPPVKALAARFDQPSSSNPPATTLSSARYVRPIRTAPTPKSSAQPRSPIDAKENDVGGPNKLYKPRSNQQRTAQQRYPQALGPTAGEWSTRLGRQDGMTQAHADGANAQLSPTLRRPLFGEVLVADPQGVQELGYGIPMEHHRRVSEGSMHLPNPMFPRSQRQSQQDISPLHMHFDYHRDASFPEDVSQSWGHRKSRSETAQQFANLHIEPSYEYSPNGSLAPRRESPSSRIPVLTSRPRTSSDSSSPTASRTPSALGHSRYTSSHPPDGSMLPTRVPQTRTKSKGIQSHMPNSPPKTPPRTSAPRRYGDNRDKSPNGNHRLKATIHAPLPKTSPPLRKSKSREHLNASHGHHKTAHREQQDKIRRSPLRQKRTVGLGEENFEARRTLFEQKSEESLQRPKPLVTRKRSPGNSEYDSSGREGSPDSYGFPRTEAGPSESTSSNNNHLGDGIAAIGKLTLTTHALPNANGSEPMTGATEFSDESPIWGSMPGQFPHTSPDPAQGSSQLQASNMIVPKIVRGRYEGNERKETQQLGINAGSTAMQRPNSPSAVSRASTEFAEDAAMSGADEEATINIVLGATPAVSRLQKPWDVQDPNSMPDYRTSWHRIDHIPPEQGITFLDDEESPTDPYSIISPASQNSKDAPSLPMQSTSEISPLQQDSHFAQPQDISHQSNTPLRQRPKKRTEQILSVEGLLDRYRDRNSDIEDPNLATDAFDIIKIEFGEQAVNNVNWHSKPDAIAYLDKLLQDLEYAAILREIHEEETAQSSQASPEPRARASPSKRKLEKMGQPTTVNYAELQSTPDLGQAGTAMIWSKDQDYQDDMDYSEGWHLSPPNGSDDNLRLSANLSGPPKLPEITGAGEGLGLAIKVTPPEPSPSAPTHAPPPPPNMDMYNDNPEELYRTAPGAPVQFGNMSGGHVSVQSLPNSYNSDSQQSFPMREYALLDPDSEEAKKLNSRIRVLKEIVLSEDALRQDFTILCTIWMESSKIILSDEQREILFGNSAEVLELVQHLDRALKQTVKPVFVKEESGKWNFEKEKHDANKPEVVVLSSEADGDVRVGAVISQHVEWIERVYGKYLKNNSGSMKLLNTLIKDPNFLKWQNLAKEQSKDLTFAWDLNSMLVKPLQRLTKYPLLLKELLAVTPDEHPDRADIVKASDEILSITQKINDEQKRTEVFEKAMQGRRKPTGDSSAQAKSRNPIALHKLLVRRTEKLKQQVGLSDAVEDPEYDAVAQKFGGHFFQLQIVMRDVEKYLEDVTTYTHQAMRFAGALDAFVDVHGSRRTHPEIESKWRKYSQCVREITLTALPEHVSKEIYADGKTSDSNQSRNKKSRNSLLIPSNSYGSCTNNPS